VIAEKEGQIDQVKNNGENDGDDRGAIDVKKGGFWQRLHECHREGH
jgi:hypothetical protein